MAKEFSRNLMNDEAAWREHLLPLAAREIRALEIGTYEGQTACWLLDNVLKNPLSTLDCIDPFGFPEVHDSEAKQERTLFVNGMGLDRAEAKWRKNTAEYGDKIILYTDPFWPWYPLLKASYNLIIVDGAHAAFNCLNDLLGAWQILEPSGILLVDDYGWTGDHGWKSDGPKRAIDAFLSVLPKDDYEILYKGFIVIMRKLYNG